MPLKFEPLPVFTIDSQDLGGVESMEEFRRSVADLFDAVPIGDDPHQIDMTATHLGNLLLSEVSSSPLQRPARRSHSCRDARRARHDIRHVA